LKQIVAENKGVIGAIGECGLDYYWLERGEKRKAKSEIQMIKSQQVDLFRKQIELAKRYELPIVVHSRGAEEECLSIINRQSACLAGRQAIFNKKTGVNQQKVLFHCYTGDRRIAESIFEAGYYISFNGILTYKNADDIREIFKFGWKNYRNLILAETDAPYLKPRCMVQPKAVEPTARRVQGGAPEPTGGSFELAGGESRVQRRGVEPTVCEPRDVVYVVEKMAEIVGLDTREVAEVTVRNAVEFYMIK
jgi:TatD family hydrolase